jgi:hypothetical protein
MAPVDDRAAGRASDALVMEAMSLGYPSLVAATSIAGAASLLCTTGWLPATEGPSA